MPNKEEDNAYMVARMMLSSGCSIPHILLATDLSIDELEQIKNDLVEELRCMDFTDCDRRAMEEALTEYFDEASDLDIEPEPQTDRRWPDGHGRVRKERQGERAGGSRREAETGIGGPG